MFCEKKKNTNGMTTKVNFVLIDSMQYSHFECSDE